MIARLAVLACAVLCGNAAIAATQYGVDELGVGAQLKFASASSREFCCNPSEQFESASGLTHIVRLEKQQSAAEATRLEATTASGAKIGNQDTVEDRVGEPSDAHAVKPPSDAEQAAADAESSRWEKINWWESFAFGTIAGSCCSAWRSWRLCYCRIGGGKMRATTGRCLAEADRSPARTSGARWRDDATCVIAGGSPR
jgi:hypothetical protein